VAIGIFFALSLPGTKQGTGFDTLPEQGKARRIFAERRIDRPGLRVDLDMPGNVVLDFRKRLRYQAQVDISFARGPAMPAMLRVRGATTRWSERKSFLVTLFETQKFTEVKLRKFLLLNMLFDPHRFEMYTGYRLLAELGLFPSYFQYVSVFINGKPQGLYLLVERPEDAIRRSSSNVVSVIRPNGRRARAKYSVKYSIPQSDPLRLVHSIRRATRKKNGKALEDELDRKMNLDRYLRWLAFNSLSENGDSRNELYLFEERAQGAQWGRLDLVAWDYDDIQERPIRAAEVLRDPLLYGCEMDLDFVIREDKQLYSRYKRVLRNLLEELLTEEKLIATLRNVRETVDRIDSGLPHETQLAARNDRAEVMLAFQERLLSRRKTLLALLDQP
jgi:hypothetical protein